MDKASDRIVRSELSQSESTKARVTTTYCNIYRLEGPGSACLAEQTAVKPQTTNHAFGIWVDRYGTESSKYLSKYRPLRLSAPHMLSSVHCGGISEAAETADTR